MNILGVGPEELIVILLIALIFAGPKRMLRWAYYAGQAIAKLRVMWSEIMDVVQKEINAAGFDVELSRDLPTRASITKVAQEVLKPAVQPVEQAINEVKDTQNQIIQVGKEVKNDVSTNVDAIKDATSITKTQPNDKTNAYSQESQSNTTTTESFSDNDSFNNSVNGFGTWSSPIARDTKE